MRRVIPGQGREGASRAFGMQRCTGPPASVPQSLPTKGAAGRPPQTVPNAFAPAQAGQRFYRVAIALPAPFPKARTPKFRFPIVFASFWRPPVHRLGGVWPGPATRPGLVELPPPVSGEAFTR
jgi:hypothetical protein